MLPWTEVRSGQPERASTHGKDHVLINRFQYEPKRNSVQWHRLAQRGKLAEPVPSVKHQKKHCEKWPKCLRVTPKCRHRSTPMEPRQSRAVPGTHENSGNWLFSCLVDLSPLPGSRLRKAGVAAIATTILAELTAGARGEDIDQASDEWCSVSLREPHA